MTSVPIFKRKVLRIEGSRHSALDKARGRLVLVSAFFVLAYILVAARLVDLVVIQGHWGTGNTLERSAAMTAPAPLPVAPRADILDRNGVLLAASLETASLYADPFLIRNPAATAQALADRFPELVYGEVLKKLQQESRFVWIRRNLTPQEQYAVLEIGDPGLAFKPEYQRIYPQGNLFAHMVGFVDIDGRGLAGIERSFDKLLQEGREPLSLTLDVRLQYILHKEVSTAIKDFTAQAGAGVIFDIQSGEILAAVSLPDFNPHDPGAARNDDSRPLFNRLTHGVYELGSTFKIFSTAALLENFEITMAHSFDARKPLERGRFRIADYHPEKRMLTIPEVFVASSNIGSALMGEMLGTHALRSFYEDIGLLRRQDLAIEEVGAPLVPDPWREINTLTASYGHGLAVTPLQMTTAAASIVNGGIRVNPVLVLDRNRAEKTQNRPEVRIVSSKTAHRMRQLMRLVVTDGTGQKADVPGYRVGGKTGTAEKSGPGGYDRERLISSFIGFFPMDAPRYAVFVMVDEPEGNSKSYGYATAGWVAAPAVGRIIAAMGPLLGITPEVASGDADMAGSLRRYIHFKEKEGPDIASY